jgi:hypothetical protein
MKRTVILTAMLAAAGVFSAHATNLAAIIQKVSGNCDKIQSFNADIEVRYHI